MLSNLHASFLSEFSWDVFSAFFCIDHIRILFFNVEIRTSLSACTVINFKFLTIQIWCAIAYHWLSASDFRGGGLNEYYSNTYYEFQKNPFTFRKMLFVENFHWNFNAMLRKRIDLVLFYISF